MTQVLVVKSVTFSYEAYACEHDLTQEGREAEADRLQAKLRELLKQIDSDYTTGVEALKVDKLVVHK
jgi:hypothetical protein